MTAAWHGGCECGRVKIRLSQEGVATGTRIICCCESCRAADIYLRGDKHGLTQELGVEIFQTTPDRLEIEDGAADIRAIRLSEKGIIRWYASCCGAPLFNTLANPKTAFVGVVLQPVAHDPAAPELGEARAVRKNAAPEGAVFPHKDGNVLGISLQIVQRMIGGKFRGGTNPLVNANGEFMFEPVILDGETRASAYEAAK